VQGGDYVKKSMDGEETRTPVEIVREIPATMTEPWVKVMSEVEVDGTVGMELKKESAAAWWVVPASTLVKKSAPRWDNFRKSVVAMKEFPNYLKNTLILCFLTVIGTVVSSAFAAYGFARISWRGRNKVFLIALATMMIPFPVVMVPVYCMFRWLGMIGTLKPLWIGSFMAGAFNVFLLRQFFMTIPKDLSEAARIDGCSEFRIFWQIILPLSKPALMVVGLFQFMATWNDYLGPLIYLTNQKDFTLALGLQFFQSQQGGTQWHYLMAASTLVVLPVIVLFFFTQRTFIEGISMTGIKG
jgi:multiple sugar transport system permease protein